MPDFGSQKTHTLRCSTKYSKFDFVDVLKSTLSSSASTSLSAPAVVSWQLTLQCNLTCRYCYANSAPDRIEENLDRKATIQIAERLGNSGVIDVSLEGGEPLRSQWFPDVVRTLKRFPLALDILTNGTLLDDKQVKFLNKALDKRIDTFQISIDSLDTSSNDINRGQGTLDQACRAVELLLKHGFNVRTNTVVTAENVLGLPELYSELARLGVNGGFGVAPVFPIGRGSTVERPDDDVVKSVLSQLVALSRVTPHLRIYGARSLTESESGAKHGLRLCSAARAKLAVKPSGIVTPCVFFPAERFSLGRLPDQSIAEIWTGERIRSFRSWLTAIRCSGCRNSATCMPRCPGIAFADCMALRRSWSRAGYE